VNQWTQLTLTRRGLGNTEVPDLHELWYAEERTDVGHWLDEHGWRVSVTSSNEAMAQYGRIAASSEFATASTNLFISAERVR
jgi:O-methyltransferase involved in polyketide biosynthesis